MPIEKEDIKALCTAIYTLLEAMAMHWANVDREQQGYALAYDEGAFMDLTKRGKENE